MKYIPVILYVSAFGLFMWSAFVPFHEIHRKRILIVFGWIVLATGWAMAHSLKNP